MTVPPPPPNHPSTHPPLERSSLSHQSWTLTVPVCTGSGRTNGRINAELRAGSDAHWLILIPAATPPPPPPTLSAHPVTRRWSIGGATRPLPAVISAFRGRAFGTLSVDLPSVIGQKWPRSSCARAGGERAPWVPPNSTHPFHQVSTLTAHTYSSATFLSPTI